MSADPAPLDIFPRASEEDWRALVAKTIKEGADSLASLSDDRMAVGPLYRQDGPGSVLAPARRWKIIQRIDLADPLAAKRQLAEDLAGGADGLEIVSSDSINARGAGVDVAGVESVARASALADAHLRVDAGPAALTLASLLAKGSGLAGLTAAFDPLATMESRGRAEHVADAVALAGALDHHGIAGAALIADGRFWHNAGASEAEELAAVAATLVAHLRALEAAAYPPDRAIGRLAVTLAADTEQFLTIAKFRAARLLAARLVEAIGAARHAIPLHGETSWRVMTALDPHTNILRATIGAFGAAVGGADSITVLPFDSVPGPASAHGRRLARNTQLLLLDESHLARVADPAAGSGAIEALTGGLAAAAWSLFQSIEAEGGFANPGARARFADRVGQTAASRADKIERRERLIVGSSIYPLTAEAAPPAGADFGSHRLAEPFEAARRR